MASLVHAVLGLPVDHGFVLGAITVAAVVATVRALGRSPRRWRSWGLSTVAALVIVVAVGHIVGIENRVGSSFPRSFYLWAALPLGTVVDGLLHRGGQARRATTVLAALLLFTFSAGQVNAHYSYVPTVGDVVGAPLRDQVPARTASAVLAGSPTSASPPATRVTSGILVPVRIPATRSRFSARGGYVWLPPAYARSPRPSLPVVVMLAGVPGDPSNLLRGGHAAQIADSFASAHHGLAPILVFPDQNGGMWSDSECVDGPRGHAETYLTVDVPAFVSATFGTAPGGPTWAIVGYSEGGTCALTLTLRHPDLFGSFVDIAGDLRANAHSSNEPIGRTVTQLYGGDRLNWAAHDPLRLLERHPNVDATFVVGTHDHRARAAADRLAAAAASDVSASRLVIVDGGHSFAMVTRALRATLPDLSTRLLDAAHAQF